MNEQDYATGNQESRENRFTSRDQRRDIINSLCSQAERSILIFAPILDGYTFNSADLGDHLKNFVTLHRNNEARFLVADPRQVVQYNERLMAIARRFGDFIRFRQLGEIHAGRTECYIVIDDRDFLFQRDIAYPDGMVSYNDRKEAIQYKQRFEDLWQHSEPMTGLNTLGL